MGAPQRASHLRRYPNIITSGGAWRRGNEGKIMESADRLARALLSLDGLSVGDAFGERFFVHHSSLRLFLGERALPAPPWRFTDDTQMALSIVETLARYGEIDQGELAKSFGRHYDISRGYGPAMHRLLPLIRSGKRWDTESRNLFGGSGSYGNGAAMRVAPVGAYFADDLDTVVEHAAKSAMVTHAHPEGVAGAIAVAVAAAVATRSREAQALPEPGDFIEAVLAHVPTSEVAARLRAARELPADTMILDATMALGNGSRVSAQDTAPYCIWCAARHLTNYEEALWTTVSGLGDRDTTCAIVGGIVACAVGSDGIPNEWMAAREPLPEWRDPTKP